MVREDIPTAEHRVFRAPQEARHYIEQKGVPIVVKADGLAAGKGAIVAHTMKAAREAIHGIMEEKLFGPAGNRVVVEEFLEGQEASILALVDGKNFLTMIPSQDHKPIFDGDRGPNTGGMGAYAPVPVITEALMAQIEERILRPAVDGLVREGCPYRGVLYAGLMITSRGPKVVEFNCRFGDPETQAILPLLEEDLLELLLAVCDGSLEGREVRWSAGAAVCVVMSSGGYPGPYQRGVEIKGLDRPALEDVLVFHAGTKREGFRVLTDGGRVLGVTGLGADFSQAARRAYRATAQISFQGAHYRRDIAHRAMARGGFSQAQFRGRSPGSARRPCDRGNALHPPTST
jgi:phosphoribosylamine--glycine ligase